VDDLLDVIGDEATVGKTLSSDEENQKTTFLSFYDIEGVRRYAEELTDKAIEEIREIEGSEVLVALAEYLLQRKK
jgi:geranylgeranyl diphosphate synthase type II